MQTDQYRQLCAVIAADVTNNAPGLCDPSLVAWVAQGYSTVLEEKFHPERLKAIQDHPSLPKLQEMFTLV